MKIKINGEQKELTQDTLTVTELLKTQNVDMPDMVTVELNGEIVDRADFDTATVSDGHELEFLYFMGGGHL